MRMCFEVLVSQFPIRLLQDGKNNFTVEYGLQVDSNLKYGDAAAKLGQSIMHALACEGELDNQ